VARLLEGRTGVIVAHDAGWADLADEVVHLEAGRRADALIGSGHG
jgi:ATP-binding cassette subfamily C protein CydD